jgi:hypothetical protein
MPIPMANLQPRHVIAAAVAVGCVANSLSDGGYEAEAFAVAALIAWVAVLVGLAAGLLPRAVVPGHAYAAGACLAGFAALTALSTAWAGDDAVAFEDTVRFLFYLGLFVLVVVASRRGEAAAWLLGLASGLAAVAVLALVSRFQPGLLGHPDFELALRLPAATGRLSYPIGYWNALAAAMAACIVLLGWLGATARVPAARAAATALIALPVLVIYMAGSWGGAVAAALGAIALMALGPMRVRLAGTLAIGSAGGLVLLLFASRRTELLDFPESPPAVTQGDEMSVITIAVVAGVAALRYAVDRPLARLAIPAPPLRPTLVVIAIAAIAAIVVADPAERWEEFKEPPPISQAESSVQEEGSPISSRFRYQYWSTAVEAFADEPVTGIGSGEYEPYWAQHGSTVAASRNAHSIVFESLAELGLLGLALVIAFFAVLAAAGWRRARDGGPTEPVLGATAGVLVTGIAAAAADWTYEVPAVFALTIVAAALLVGATMLPAGDEIARTREAPGRSRPRFATGVTVLLVAWISICAAGLLLFYERSLDSSRVAIDEGRTQDAIDAAEDASRLQPWAAAPRVELARAYEQAGDLATAREEISAAIERAPDDWRHWVTEVRLAAESGDADAARAAYGQARRLNPRDTRLELPLAEFYGLIGAQPPRPG